MGLRAGQRVGTTRAEGTVAIKKGLGTEASGQVRKWAADEGGAGEPDGACRVDLF